MNRKLILGLGSLAIASLPITALVSCNDKEKIEVSDHEEEKYQVTIPNTTSITPSSDQEIEAALTKGLSDGIKGFAPLKQPVTVTPKVLPIFNYNYAGAIGIMNAIYKHTLWEELEEENEKALKNVQAILRALLLDQTILGNKVGQNLNSKKVAQEFFNELDSKGVEGLAHLGTLDSEVLKFTNGDDKGSKVQLKLSSGEDGQISVQFAIHN